jgi:hypothetical protein
VRAATGAERALTIVGADEVDGGAAACPGTPMRALLAARRR